MFAAANTQPVLSQRIKLGIAAALLALSLIAGATQVDAKPRRQPPVDCIHYSQAGWIIFANEDPGPNGYWEGYFVQ